MLCFAKSLLRYYLRNDALACKRYFDGMKLDERYIRVDLDPGFREGRQFGRGRRGGQVKAPCVVFMFTSFLFL